MPFRVLFEQAGVGVAQLDTATGRFLRVNQKYCDILGYSAAELLELDFMRVTYPDDLAADLANMARLVAGEIGSFAMEKRLRQKDGGIVWVDLTVSKTWRDGEPPRHHIAVVVDCSMRKLSEAALKMLSTELAMVDGAAFFHAAASGVARLLNLEFGFVGRLQPSNDPRVRMVGLVMDGQAVPVFEYDLAGTPCEDVIAGTACCFDRDVQARFPADHMLEELGVSAYAAVPVFDRTGHALGHIGVMSRTPFRHTDRVMAVLQLCAVRTGAEIEREDSAARFQDLFEFSPDAVLMVSESGRITMANRRAVALYGYTHDELLTLDVEALLPKRADPARHIETRRSFIQSSEPRAMGSGRQLRALRKDGTEVAVDISLNPMQTRGGRVVIVAVRDVTERVRAEDARAKLEAQLRQSQKMQAIGALAGGIAHDFNNALAVIFSNLELVRMHVPAGHAASEGLDDIELASERARDLVRQILMFSSDHRVPLHRLALRPLAEETAKLLRGVFPSGAILTLDLGDDVPDVVADATQVHQLLMNLCTNAAHALEGRPGSVTVRLEAVVLDEATPPLRAGAYVCLSVRDDGKGIDAATLERVFEPFFTTKPAGEGTGLGLAVVHGIMEAHRGAVIVTSQVGEGSTFRLYFPVGPVDNS